jgi:leader peptidase (prepilin peptidase)/N-methyltransferase
MDKQNEPSNSHPTLTPTRGGSAQKVLPKQYAPYGHSLFGRCSWLVLLLLAVPLAFLFAYWMANRQPGVLGLIATCLLLVSLITSRGNQVLRICLLLAMAVNIFAVAIAPSKILGKIENANADLATYVLVICLATASLFEIYAWAKSSPRKTLIKTLGWGLLAVPALAYIVGVPLFEMLWDGIIVDERKNALKDPEWNFFNEAAFRAAKFLVFAVFTYVGACWGSFLNVVAYCVPRGEAIGVRDSKCPVCDTKIRRSDNLPIFSYINLGGRCRNCSTAIPARYLIAELVVALIFGSLFLYELVTGCANVPHMRTIHHQGILWIILYPKWPAIGMYFYHAFFMSALLVLSLMESDKQPLKLIFAVLVGLPFFIAAAVYHPIQPVPFFEHWPGAAVNLSSWVEQAAKLVAGGIIGAAMGGLIVRAFFVSHLSILTFAYALTGLVLGWQALLQVTVFFGILALAAQSLPGPKSIRCNPTGILLAAVALHHPCWKTINSWWPI